MKDILNYFATNGKLDPVRKLMSGKNACALDNKQFRFIEIHGFLQFSNGVDTKHRTCYNA
jgi:hypothetical protein